MAEIYVVIQNHGETDISTWAFQVQVFGSDFSVFTLFNVSEIQSRVFETRRNARDHVWGKLIDIDSGWGRAGQILHMYLEYKIKLWWWWQCLSLLGRNEEVQIQAIRYKISRGVYEKGNKKPSYLVLPFSI